MFAMYLADPDRGDDAIGHMFHEDVGHGFAQLASSERVDGERPSPVPIVNTSETQ